MTTLVNLTPHPVRICTDGVDITLSPCGITARVTVTLEEDGCINNVPVFRQKFGQVENLPGPEADTVYIVSAVVLDAVRSTRPDVVAPLTARAARDESGNIVSVPGLVR